MKRAKDSLCNKVTTTFSRSFTHINAVRITQTYSFFCYIINKQLKVSKMNKCYPLLCHTCIYRFYFAEFFRNVMQTDTLPGIFFCFTFLFCFFLKQCFLHMRLASNLAIHKEGWPWIESLASISQVLELQACVVCPAPRNVLKPICPWNGNK